MGARNFCAAMSIMCGEVADHQVEAGTTLELPMADDFHCHLRQGEMMGHIAPSVTPGGIARALIMPNTVPPTSTTAMAVEYRERLTAINPEVEYFMTLYLNPDLTPDEIRAAKAAGCVGVKSYPKGLTTNSESGVEGYEEFYPIFETMQEVGLVLELHGEVPPMPGTNICVMNAERHFIPFLKDLHSRFPKLRIVLEHATTEDAVEAVKECGDTVACSITAHHLDICIDDVVGRAHNFCKPVAKFPVDRQALIDVVKSGHPRFFLGSDSAPHSQDKKECACACAGVFTSRYLMQYLADTFERHGMLDRLGAFTSEFGAAFYDVPKQVEKKIVLKKEPFQVAEKLAGDVVPYRGGETLGWSITIC